MSGAIMSRAIACASAVALVPPMAAAQDAASQAAAGAPGAALPLAAVRGEETCKLVSVKLGGSAELVEEKTPDEAELFPFLQTQDALLDEFRVEEDTWKSCGFVFGVVPGGLTQAAAGAGAGSLAGAGIGVAVGASIAGVVAAGVVAATVAGGGNPTSTTSTVDPPAAD